MYQSFIYQSFASEVLEFWYCIQNLMVRYRLY